MYASFTLTQWNNPSPSSPLLSARFLPLIIWKLAPFVPSIPLFLHSRSFRMSTKPTIVYTLTDEAPALATRSLLPIIQAYVKSADVNVETRDISLASRVLAAFSDSLPPEQVVPDDLAFLGSLALKPEANIIKLPNISASVPQLRSTIEELQKAGFSIPDYPEEPTTDEELQIAARYSKVKGSAVNPVLREGNSDRRASKAVKEYARQYPHSMGEWSSDTKSHVSTMTHGDFYHTEQSLTLDAPTQVTIDFVSNSGARTTLKPAFDLELGEVIDAAKMSKKSLVEFLQQQLEDAKKQGVLFSIHLKATMMKVSDPVLFGHAVKVYFKDLLYDFASDLDAIGFNPNNGLGDLVGRLDELSPKKKTAVEKAIQAAYDNGPDLAMVDSDRGITNLHVPSDVIIDASMPALIRTSGNMWNKDGKLQETKCVIPDSSYAGVYQTVFDFCKKHGAFDPKTMGSIPNVGLMAKKAEEYGSHDKTFEILEDGKVEIRTTAGVALLTTEVEAGDIFRMCQAKDAPITDWVKLAVTRARATGSPSVFLLDADRPHDRELRKKVDVALKALDTSDVDIRVMNVDDGILFSLERAKDGLDTICATGNVLRDYLTDLFPILELGTSAKMLSIVPLMNGGGMFETGAGGSAPKHVQQLVKENHLRWDSLGEFLALGVSLEHLGDLFDNPKARIMGQTLEAATTEYLLTNKSPSRKVNQIDNRGSHYYLATFWAQKLAEQTSDPELAAHFKPLADELSQNEDAITKELLEVQGSPADLGGYYYMDEAKVRSVMRPSPTLNRIIDQQLAAQ